jgi:hypothetical protein
MDTNQLFYQVKVAIAPDGEIRLAGYRSTDQKAVLNCAALRISVPFELDEPHPGILKWIERTKNMGGVNVGDPVVKLHHSTEVVWEILT